MKNYEKYETKINEYNGGEFCVDFVMPYILGSDNCAGMDCVKCRTIQTIWLLKEYEESKEPKKPEVNWNKVEVNTPILVRHNKKSTWKNAISQNTRTTRYMPGIMEQQAGLQNL